MTPVATPGDLETGVLPVLAEDGSVELVAWWEARRAPSVIAVRLATRDEHWRTWIERADDLCGEFFCTMQPSAAVLDVAVRERGTLSRKVTAFELDPCPGGRDLGSALHELAGGRRLLALHVALPAQGVYL